MKGVAKHVTYVSMSEIKTAPKFACQCMKLLVADIVYFKAGFNSKTGRL